MNGSLLPGTARKLAIAWACALALASCGEAPHSRQSPNFIILLADDLGYGDLASYGHPTIRTPNLDQMAQEGVRLTQFYAASSLCTPSRAGLLTGKLPVRTGMDGPRGVLFPDSDGGLPATEATIAKALKSRGYKTACIGKWHLGHLPQHSPLEHGFDYFFGIPYSNDMHPENEHWAYAQEAFPPLPLMENRRVLETSPDQARFTQRFTSKAIEFIEANRSEPFLLYLPYSAPHTPLMFDRAARDQAGRFIRGASPSRSPAEGSSLQETSPSHLPVEGSSKRGLYGDVVEELDWSVGQILAAVKRSGLGANTFVFFTSDNGPWSWRGVDGGSAGLLHGAKGSPWEGGFRVPAIAWMPAVLPSNQVNAAMASTLDLYPTLADMAGATETNSLDGVDILPTLVQGKAVRKTFFYYSLGDLAAMRQGAWKLFLRHPERRDDETQEQDRAMLFNIEQDPSEKYDLAEQATEQVERLLALAQSHRQDIVITPSRLEGILPEYQEIHAKHHPSP